MARRLGRRRFLGAAAAGALLGSSSSQANSAGQREVRIEFLHPKELDEAKAACATIFQPLGTIEWHGVHNVLGLDAVKAHALCLRAARKGGGVVAPPLFGGVGGLSESHTFIMDPEDNVFSRLLRPWLEQLCREMARDGFRAIIILTGHYGAAQQIVVRETAVRMSRALAIPVLGTPEYWLALDVGYTGDHAAWGETSLMMHLFPDTGTSRGWARPHTRASAAATQKNPPPRMGERSPRPLSLASRHSRRRCRLGVSQHSTVSSTPKPPLWRSSSPPRGAGTPSGPPGATWRRPCAITAGSSRKNASTRSKPPSRSCSLLLVSFASQSRSDENCRLVSARTPAAA